MSESKHLMTAEGKQKLQEKLDYYIQVRRPDISAKIAAARELGDLSENADYDEAKREQAEVEEEILQMKHDLDSAEIIDESQFSDDEVRIGSKVKIRNIATKQDMTFDIIGSSESDPFHGKISNLSPLGSALLKQKKGATIKVNTPSGFIAYKLMEILPKE